MGLFYKKITITSGGSGSDDKKVKVSTDDAQAGFLEEKVVVGSNKLTRTTLNGGVNEQLEIDVNESNIDHDSLLNYEVEQHRIIDDGSTTTTSLWSSDKIQDELDSKINAATPMTDNKLVKSVGTSGVDVEATGINVDDSNNVTGINNLILDGNLTVNGTTTSVNTDTLDVEDANITVNVGGNQASADSQNAGITVEMSDATDVELGYDSTTASKFKIGEVGSTHEVLTTNHTQTIINKTIDIDDNTLSNVEVDNLKTGVLQTDISGAVSDTNLASSQAIKTYVDDQIATKDSADEISFDNTDSGLTATNVQDAIDELDGTIDTNGTTLTNHLNASAGKHNASQINFSNVASGLAATTSQEALDELSDEKLDITDFDTTFDAALALKDTGDLSEGSNLYFTDARAHISAGDLAQGSFAGDESEISQPVTGLLFANGVVRSFNAMVSVTADADSNLYEEFEIKGIQRGSDWVVTVSSSGDDTNIDFNINTSGQVLYTSPAYAGFNSMDVNFRAKVTGV